MVAQLDTDVLTRADIPVEETWDLSTIYPDDSAWDADLATIREQLAASVAHRGHLGESAARLRQALDDMMVVRRTMERAAVYAMLRKDEDTANSEALARYERVIAISIEAGEALAFVQPEVMAIDPDQLATMLSDATLEPYQHLLDDMLRHRPHTRSVEVEELLAQSADVARTARDAFGALDNVDLNFGKVVDDEGREIALTKGRYQILLESKNRETRRTAYTTMIGEYRAHSQTLAQLHSGSVRKDAFYARAHRYESSRQEALFGDNIPESVYDSLIAAVREARPEIERYYDLRRRLLGIDHLEMYDLYVPLAPQPDRRYTIAEAKTLTLDALRPLGDDYVRDLGSGYDARWVDWHETKGKRSGAYSWGVYGEPPVILMNWNGSEDHVFTLAHEAGHAMHSFYADAAQSFHDAGYPIFTAEIASTVNEVLLTWHLLRETDPSDGATRFSILNRFADTFHGTLLRQTMFAEFEHLTHAQVESGQPLTLETLNNIYGGVAEVYLPGVNIDDLVRIGWSRVPHFYRGFYVFQYATGLSAGVALARAVRDEGQSAAERYLTMLSSGGSDYPLALLKAAGVDLSTPEPVRSALQVFAETITEMEKLVDDGVFA